MNLSFIKTSLAAVSLTLGATSSAFAGVVAWDGGVNTLTAGGTISSASANSNKQGWTGNPALTYDAWGMQGSWGAFHVTSVSDVVITASSALTMAPGFTLYKTDNADQNGVLYTTTGYTGQTVGPAYDKTANTDPAWGAIHKFNQVAQAGENGLVWATGAGGIVETLGYVNGSGNDYVNSFGGNVLAGAHDVSVYNVFETGITGSVWSDADTNYASLQISNMAAGWYSIFISGTNPLLTGSPISLSVAAVPVPGAVWLFGSALMGLLGVSRRKQSV